jgi:hypothetical protein
VNIILTMVYYYWNFSFFESVFCLFKGDLHKTFVEGETSRLRRRTTRAHLINDCGENSLLVVPMIDRIKNALKEFNTIPTLEKDSKFHMDLQYKQTVDIFESVTDIYCSKEANSF